MHARYNRRALGARVRMPCPGSQGAPGREAGCLVSLFFFCCPPRPLSESQEGLSRHFRGSGQPLPGSQEAASSPYHSFRNHYCSSDSLRYHRKHSAAGVLLHLSRDRWGYFCARHPERSSCENFVRDRRKMQRSFDEMFRRLSSFNFQGKWPQYKINSVQTRCIVKGEAQKSPLFWRFSGSFCFSLDRLFSRNSTRKPLNLINPQFLETPLVI